MRAAWSAVLVASACFADAPPLTGDTEPTTGTDATTQSGGSSDAEDTTPGETALATSADSGENTTDPGESTGSSGCPGNDVCVEIPAGWLGPFAVALAPPAAGMPVCAAPYDQPHGVGFHEGLPLLDCGCECTGLGTSDAPCVAELRKYMNDTTCNDGTSSTGNGSLPGECTITGGVNSVTYALTTDRPMAPVCSPVSVEPTAMDSAWAIDAALCGLTDVAPACDAGVCLPPPSGPFTALCVLLPGELECPPEFSEQHLMFVGAEDSRECVSCGCDGITGDCTPVIYRATDEKCDDIDAGKTDCVDTSADDILATKWEATQMPGCAPTQVVNGDVSGIDPHTLCCLP